MKDKNSFLNKVRTLASGTLIAQVVAAAAAPALARLYGPEEFGTFAAYSAVAIVVAGFACLQYDLAIMIPQEHRRAAPVFVLAVSLAVGVAAACGLGVWAVRALGLHAPLGRLEGWLPVSVLAAGVLSAASYWASRMQSFRELAVSKVAHQIVNAATGIGAALAGMGSAAVLVAANIVGQFSALCYLGRTVLGRSRPDFAAGWDRVTLRAAALEHHRFPQFSIWANLLNNASWQAPVLVLGWYYSAAAVGFYAVALRIIQIPMGLISTSVGQVYLQQLSEDTDAQKRTVMTEMVFARLISIALVPCACLAISGKELFVILLGPPWADAGVLAQILAPWALIWFISSPLSSIYYVLHKQREELQLQGLLFASRTLAVWMGCHWVNLKFAVSCLALAGIVSYGILVKNIFAYVGGDIRGALGRVGAEVWWSLSALLILLGSKLADLPPLVTAGIAVVISAAATLRLLRTQGGVLQDASHPT